MRPVTGWGKPDAFSERPFRVRAKLMKGESSDGKAEKQNHDKERGRSDGCAGGCPDSLQTPAVRRACFRYRSQSEEAGKGHDQHVGQVAEADHA